MGGYIEQSDGTSWMAMYCLNMLKISMELASKVDLIYEDIASKFLEHFLYIANAMNGLSSSGLWDETDGFFYDRLRVPDGDAVPMRVRSMVGLIPIFAVDTIEPDVIHRLPGFRRRMEWFLTHRPDLCGNIASLSREGVQSRRLLSLLVRPRLTRVLQRMLDETEFLSPHGIRAVSKYHQDHPFILTYGDQTYRVDYEPAESSTFLFGGNSNWRGPVWFPVNYLLIEALERYHHFYGDTFKVECPVGSGKMLTLSEVSQELSRRLAALFLPDASGNRPYNDKDPRMQHPNWKDLIIFNEYFDGETGRGCGADHQTGWTGLVARLVQETGRRAIKAAAAAEASQRQAAVAAGSS
jgi:hypothetical protein